MKKETEKLAKYFLAALAIPEKDLWVNLSPYEKDRITTEHLSITEMGRDLLAQDYVLKQLMASLTYPESGLGKKFWESVYKKAYELYGTTDIPLNTFNKVWIVPDTAKIFEQDNTAFIVSSRLKVMLEEDYLALKENLNNAQMGIDKLPQENAEKVSNISSAIAKDVLLPAIEKEVNEGENFATLRQIYSALILALWYKKTLKETLLGQVYADKNKVKGVAVEDTDTVKKCQGVGTPTSKENLDCRGKTIREKIYQQYLEAFKKGVYNLIKEDYDAYSQQTIPRKYFSGGFEVDQNFREQRMPVIRDQAMLSQAERHDLATIQADHLANGRMHDMELQFAETGGEAIALQTAVSEERRRFLKTVLKGTMAFTGTCIGAGCATLGRSDTELMMTDNPEINEIKKKIAALIDYFKKYIVTKELETHQLFLDLKNNPNVPKILIKDFLYKYRADDDRAQTVIFDILDSLIGEQAKLDLLVETVLYDKDEDIRRRAQLALQRFAFNLGLEGKPLLKLVNNWTQRDKSFLFEIMKSAAKASSSTDIVATRRPEAHQAFLDLINKSNQNELPTAVHIYLIFAQNSDLAIPYLNNLESHYGRWIPAHGYELLKEVVLIISGKKRLDPSSKDFEALLNKAKEVVSKTYSGEPMREDIIVHRLPMTFILCVNLIY